MKKKQAVMAALAMAAMLLAGCGQKAAGGGWKADENSIYVSKDLGVESALLYTSGQDNELYKQEELETFVGEFVAAYNQEQGAAALSANAQGAEKLPVAVKSCKLEGRTGTVVFEYASPEDFVKFSGESGDDTHTVTFLQVQPVSEAAKEGGFEEVSFLTADGKAAESSAVSGQSDGGVVVIEGAAAVYTEGAVSYVSDGVMVKDGNTVLTPEGKSYIVFK